jgi:hypothetical protein
MMVELRLDLFDEVVALDFSSFMGIGLAIALGSLFV